MRHSARSMTAPTLCHKFLILVMSALLGVAATWMASPTPASAQASPTTTTPQLYVTPECLNGETGIAVSGRNFDRNRSVDVWDLYNQQDPLYGNKVTTTSSDYGTFSVTLPINLHNTYAHRVEAIYSDDPTFTSQVTVIVAGCDARITPTPRCASAPTSVDVALSNWNTATPMGRSNTR